MSAIFMLGPLELGHDPESDASAESEFCVLLYLGDDDRLQSEVCPPSQVALKLQELCAEYPSSARVGLAAPLQKYADKIGVKARALSEDERALEAYQAWSFSQPLGPVHCDPEPMVELFASLSDFLEAEAWDKLPRDDFLEMKHGVGGQAPERYLVRIMTVRHSFAGLMILRRPELLDGIWDGDESAMRHVIAFDLSDEPDWAIASLRETMGMDFVPKLLCVGERDPEPLSEVDLSSVAATLKAITKLVTGRQVARADAGYKRQAKVQVEVSLGSASQSAPAFEAPEPERSAQKVGRNDPCPCGSNKKYKKCCLGKNQRLVRRAEPERDWKQEVMELIKRKDPSFFERWSTQVYGDSFNIDEDSLSEVFVSCFYAGFPMLNGDTGLEAYFKRASTSLVGDQRNKLIALQASHPSLWEVVGIRRGEGVDLFDWLTGETCFVKDKSMSRTIVMHAGVVARVTREQEGCFVDSVEPQMLPPEAFQDVVKTFRKRIKAKKKWIDTETLKEPQNMALMLRQWNEAHRALEHASPKRLATWDGEALDAVTDTYLIESGKTPQVHRALREHPDVVEMPQTEDDVMEYTITEDPPKAKFWTTLVRAELVVRGQSLTCECFGRARSDALRSWIEALMPDAVQHESRRVEESDPHQASGDDTEDLVGERVFVNSFLEPNVDLLEKLQLRRSLYRPNKKLGGMTGPDAAKKAATRKQLHVLLAEAQFYSRLDDPEFFDRLRAGLGIDERGEKLTKARKAQKLASHVSMSDRLFELAYEVLLKTPDEELLLAVFICAAWVWNAGPLDGPEIDTEDFNDALLECLHEIDDRCVGDVPDTQLVESWMHQMWVHRWSYPEDNAVFVDSVKNDAGDFNLRVLSSAGA